MLPVKPSQFKLWISEVHEKSDVYPGRFEIIYYLRLMLGKQRPGRLQFYDDVALDHYVCKEITYDRSPEHDFKGNLRFGRQSFLPKRKQERSLVHRFKKTCPEFVHHLETSFYDFFG